LCKILDDIIEAANVSHITALVSLDISTVIDVFDHVIFIQRLEEEFNITDTCRNWIMSYLTGRSATVHVGSSSSSTVGVPHGISQGLVFGPLLYTVYIAPIGRLIHSLSVTYQQYADDTRVYTKLEVPATSSVAVFNSVLHRAGLLRF